MTEALWQEVEYGSYDADLPLWERLAAEATGPVLELGCGVGRVSLALARRGHRVVGIDRDAAMIAELEQSAERDGLPLRTECADAAGFDLGETFALVLAPMQLLQLLPADARRSCLREVARHLRPGGLAAFALVDGAAAGAAPSPPLPDVRERDGNVYSSLPLGVVADDAGLVVDRLRQTVDPAGELSERRQSVRLWALPPGVVESEGRAAGLRPSGRERIEPSDQHVGSTVILLEA
jgi:SAM-dependent methyltransferase